MEEIQKSRRLEMVEQQIRRRGVRDPRVLHANAHGEPIRFIHQRLVEVHHVVETDVAGPDSGADWVTGSAAWLYGIS